MPYFQSYDNLPNTINKTESLSILKVDALNISSSEEKHDKRNSQLLLIFPADVRSLMSPIERKGDNPWEKKWPQLTKDSGTTLRVPSPVEHLIHAMNETSPMDSSENGTRQRRSIFNHRNNNLIPTRAVSCSDTSEGSQNDGAQRKRSTSMPLTATGGYSSFFDSSHKNQNPRNEDWRMYGISRHELREFPRPIESRFQRKYLKEIDELPQIQSLLNLPELPSPLQRLRKNSGVYPLNSPESILRVKTNSQRRKQYAEINATEEKSEFSPCVDDMSSARRNSTSHAVRFDPRVTVTEYDDQSTRQWYSDRELESFKLNTALLVKQYFMSHPEALVEYNTPILDPITGAMRRKALFCLPILGCPSGNSMSEPQMKNAVNIQDYLKTMQYMAESEVKNILVVDPNALILDLFKRSLLMLFPHAKIETALSGSEALELLTTLLASEQRAHDIIIADERLHIPIQRSPVLRSSGALNESHDKGNGKFYRGGSFNDSSRSLPVSNAHDILTGSQLFHKILHVEQESPRSVRPEPRSKAIPEATLALSIQPSSLFVGVACNKTDATRLLDGGADFIWGKPPPPMNNALRNQMVVALVEKRKLLSP